MTTCATAVTRKAVEDDGCLACADWKKSHLIAAPLGDYLFVMEYLCWLVRVKLLGKGK